MEREFSFQKGLEFQRKATSQKRIKTRYPERVRKPKVLDLIYAGEIGLRCGRGQQAWRDSYRSKGK